MYLHPINIAVGPFSSLLFLTLNQETGGSNLYIAQLHNPVQKVEVLKESVAAKEVHFKNSVVFLAGNELKRDYEARGFQCLNTVLKNSSKFQNYTDMTLLTC